MHADDTALLIIIVPWILGMWVAAIIQFRWVNGCIRRRVDATGHSVSSEYATGLLVWGGIKAVLWPVTLVTWMLRGRSRAVPA